jgi:adenylate cyclase 2
MVKDSKSFFIVPNAFFLFLLFRTQNNSNILLIGSLGATSISIGLFLYLSHYEMSITSEPGNNGPGQIISSVRSIRLAIFLITTSLIGACAVFNVIDFSQTISEPLLVIEDYNLTFVNNTNVTSTLPPFVPIPQNSDIPPIYLFLCGLSLSAISAFLRAGFILKLVMMILTVILQTVILYTSRLFEQYEEYSESM